ncbi:MAG: hypothetical protein IKP48_06555 [Bacteroidaceae bacterium]|jgi:hypothetical protein|nr:hypothetical protein [Bacteroidaceae bacterium]
MRKLLLFLLLSSVALFAAAQKLEWRLGAEGFFDNGEGDDTYRTTMTYSGLRATPEIGLSWGEGKHSLMGGYSGLLEFGKKHGYADGTPILYYNYKTIPLTFTFGSFQRDKLLGDYPSFLFSDTIRYYRPTIQGIAFQHQHSRGYFEAFLDWTGLRSDTEREQFMVGLSVKHAIGKVNQDAFDKYATRFYVGLEGYYYHYALTWHADDKQHIHDNLVGHPFVGYRLQSRVTDAALDVRAGALVSFDRERGLDDGKRTPVGFLGEINANYKRFSFEEIIYAGNHQQPFGNRFFGEYYWGDTYYQASAYSRTDIKYQFIVNEYVSAYAGAIFNVTKAGLNWHQVLTLQVNLGGSLGRK